MIDFIVVGGTSFVIGFLFTMLWLRERERHRVTKEILADTTMARDRWRDLARDMAARRGDRSLKHYIN